MENHTVKVITSLRLISLAQCGNGVRCCRTGPNCWDCSGLIFTAYARAGISGLPGNTRAYPNSKVQKVSSPQPGDIIWKPGHVQLYVSANEICEAASKKTGTVCRKQWYKGPVTYYRVVGAGSAPASTGSAPRAAAGSAPRLNADTTGFLNDDRVTGGSGPSRLLKGLLNRICPPGQRTNTLARGSKRGSKRSGPCVPCFKNSLVGALEKQKAKRSAALERRIDNLATGLRGAGPQGRRALQDVRRRYQNDRNLRSPVLRSLGVRGLPNGRRNPSSRTPFGRTPRGSNGFPRPQTGRYPTRPGQRRPTGTLPRRPGQGLPNVYRPTQRKPTGTLPRRPTGTRPTQRRPTGTRPRPINRRPGQKRPTNKRPINKRPINRRPGQKRPTNRRPMTKRPGYRPNVKRPTNRRPISKRPTQRRPTQRRPISKRPTQRRPTQRRPQPQRRPTQRRPPQQRRQPQRRPIQRPGQRRPIQYLRRGNTLAMEQEFSSAVSLQQQIIEKLISRFGSENADDFGSRFGEYLQGGNEVRTYAEDMARTIFGEQNYITPISKSAQDHIEAKLQVLLGSEFVSRLPDLNWEKAQVLLSPQATEISREKRVISSLVSAKETIGSIPQQAKQISTQVKVIKIDLSQALKQKSQCCATRSPCCRQKLTCSNGKSYKSVVRHLARRTRNLLREIAQRKLERGRHARTRRMLRRLSKRIRQMGVSL